MPIPPSHLTADKSNGRVGRRKIVIGCPAVSRWPSELIEANKRKEICFEVGNNLCCKRFECQRLIS